jgi:hypothetical protein
MLAHILGIKYDTHISVLFVVGLLVATPTLFLYPDILIVRAGIQNTHWSWYSLVFMAYLYSLYHLYYKLQSNTVFSTASVTHLLKDPQLYASLLIPIFE